MPRTPDSPPPEPPPQRHRVRVRGVVQGVGFRPTVFRLTSEEGLTGWVRNDGQGVELEVQGAAAALARFLERLEAEAPPLAHIDAVEAQEVPALDPPEAAFSIVASGQGAKARTGVTPDAATCVDCLTELFDPADRRHRYPFTNCTNCGPRYTITGALPYDRPNTSMAKFVMCPSCQAEYDDPLDRRFHAQPNACPVCGPQLALVDPAGRSHDLSADDGDPLAAALTLLQRGGVLALKGLGGFHLACDARDPAAVAALRRRKQREAKPLAVMVAGAASLAGLAEVSEQDHVLLASVQRPIVLLRKQAGCDAALEGVAPGIAWLGAVLPYTPLHALLFHEAAGRPPGTAWMEAPQQLCLVMTSANPGGEPLVTDNDEALRRLGGIADALLVHDREILVGCDDSVARATSEANAAPAFIRRARGYTPRAIKLPTAGPSVLACGAWYKSTICLTRDDEAFLSQHVGDLDNAPTCEALVAAAAHLMEVLQIQPEVLAMDLHPDFFSSQHAASLAAEWGLPCEAVQHHHAHAASVLAERGAAEQGLLERPVLALTLDGVGLGSDGAAWGGELLRLRPDGAFDRLGHLRPLALPGGDRAAREPWRMALSALHALGRPEEALRRYEARGAETLLQMLERGVNAPPSSSAGRLFDAAAGLLGLREVSAFEAQAAMELEGLAQRHGVAPALEAGEGFVLDADGQLDLLPLLGRLADEREPGRGAALLHATLSRALERWTVEAAAREGLRDVVLAGGCMVNHVLASSLRAGLQAQGLRVHEAALVPANDGGLSLGQAWVAISRRA
jgi:hydrogenase maturation protein HypF